MSAILESVSDEFDSKKFELLFWPSLSAWLFPVGSGIFPRTRETVRPKTILLSAAEKQLVFFKIVESSGESNDGVSEMVRKVSTAGRGLLVLSLAWTVYTVVAAEDHVEALKKEAALAGAGIAGGVSGGALAGLACGPGSPVCVAVGAFVGGALAAFPVDAVW